MEVMRTLAEALQVVMRTLVEALQVVMRTLAEALQVVMKTLAIALQAVMAALQAVTAALQAVSACTTKITMEFSAHQDLRGAMATTRIGTHAALNLTAALQAVMAALQAVTAALLAVSACTTKITMEFSAHQDLRGAMATTRIGTHAALNLTMAITTTIDKLKYCTLARK
jgi:hypothetical protein